MRIIIFLNYIQTFTISFKGCVYIIYFLVREDTVQLHVLYSLFIVEVSFDVEFTYFVIEIHLFLLHSLSYQAFIKTDVPLNVPEILMWRKIDLWSRCSIFVFIHIPCCRSCDCVLYKNLSHYQTTYHREQRCYSLVFSTYSGNRTNCFGK